MLYQKFCYNIEQLTHGVTARQVAIAVSGGVDSVSLLSLLSIWAQHNGVGVTVMYVNHHMREQSILEHEYVSELSQKFGFDYFQLHFDHQNNFSNFQARAREARYQLMTNLCCEFDILTLITAHHLGDYTENFCIKLARKSGAFGLSSTNVHWYNNTRIIRPLFNIQKQELIDYLTINNIHWFEDESNTSDKYQRNIIRKKIASREQYNAANIILRQKQINDLVENNLRPTFVAAIAELVQFYEFGFAHIDLLQFTKLAEEVKLQLLSFVLIMVSGNDKGARAYSLNPMLASLNMQKDFKKTLHGCIIKKVQNDVLIYREFGKKKPLDISLAGKTDVIWDKRFCLKSVDIPENCYVTHLTLNDYCHIKQNLNLQSLKDCTFGEHFVVLLTMPVVKILEKVMAIPHISYYDEAVHEISVLFCPQFTSRFTHFC